MFVSKSVDKIKSYKHSVQKSNIVTFYFDNLVLNNSILQAILLECKNK